MWGAVSAVQCHGAVGPLRLAWVPGRGCPCPAGQPLREGAWHQPTCKRSQSLSAQPCHCQPALIHLGASAQRCPEHASSPAEYNRADSDNERTQHSPDAHRDGYVQAVAAAAAAAATAGHNPLGVAGNAAAPWHASEQQADSLLKQMAGMSAAGGMPGAAGLAAGAVPSGLLQALLGQQAPPAAAGSPSLVGLSGAGMPRGLAGLLQQAAHAAPQAHHQPLQHMAAADPAAVAAAVAAVAARQHADGGGENATLQDAAVLQALSGLVQQLQHAQPGSQQQGQPLPQQLRALAATLAASAGAGDPQLGQQDSQWMEALITVVQQLAVQREQLQEQQAVLAAQAQQISALAAQVASQGEQLAAARASLQTASAARLRQAEQLSLQARQQQELWGAVQALQGAVQPSTGAPLPQCAPPAAPHPHDNHATHAAGEASAAMLRALLAEAAAQQAHQKHSAHDGAVPAVPAVPAGGLHQLQAVLAAVAAASRHQRQAHQPQQLPQQQPQVALSPRAQQQQPQVALSPRAQQQQPQPQQHAPEVGVGSQQRGGTPASPAGGSPMAGTIVQEEAPAHNAGSGSSSGSPSRKRPRAESTSDQ